MGYTMIRLRMHMNLLGQLGTGISLLQGDTLRDERGDRLLPDNEQELPYPNWQANDSVHPPPITSAS